MIRISIPNNNKAERIYVLEYLFSERLGFTVNIEISDSDFSKIRLPNNSIIEVKDSFFNHYKVEYSYLSLDYLPSTIKYINLQDFSSLDLPIIFGENTLAINSSHAVIGFDFLADIFFYLSRWDENITNFRDELSRPIENKLFIVKHGLYKRPVVDEFVSFIIELMQKLGFTCNTLNKSFNIIPTHDVDYVKKWRNDFCAWKEIGGDAIIRKNLKRSIYNLTLWLSLKLKFIDEPNATIGYLINLAEKYNRKAFFFFMTGGNTPWDSFNLADLKILKNWAKKIITKNYSLGIHPSILAASDKEIFHNEIQNLVNLSQQTIRGSRQHYLSLKIPQTWKILEENKVDWDFSCGFSNYLGFRCGTANPYKVFDLVERKKLNVQERPLIVMDTAIAEHLKIPENEAIAQIRELKLQIHKFGGEFIFLFHNSSLNAYEYQDYKSIISVLYQ